MSRFKQIDLSKVRAYPASSRPSKVKTDEVATPPRAGMTVRELLDGLPKILKAEDLKAVAQAVVDAKKNGKPIIAMIGGHVIKTGCAPILANLAEQGYITHVASNGSAAIHDTELARFGHTSEDVAVQLADGSFGMAGDTAQLVNEAAKVAQERGDGFGETVGRLLVEENGPYLDRALLAKCHQLGVPYTLHVAIGTDIIHQHPSADGSAIGDASYRDFKIFTATVSTLGHGGVVLNIGSAVIMPEVLLKAVAVARNLGHDVVDFTTANFDMIQHYRPWENVVRRPVLTGGKGYQITGHHEIMIPLLAAAIHEEAASRK